ncbi:MAG: phosphodiester glycosidase family protein [Micrococcales bacterium]|nr:phosphodiester glycosidase family protein [Micrococcales bacterium]
MVLAAGGGAWWAADRFLIEHVEIADVSAYEASYGTPSNATETDTDTDAATDTEAVITDNSAVFAINGDYYGFRDTGIVIRNGVVYRDEPAREGLVFYEDGTVAVYDETTTSADELLAEGAWNTLSFGPAIVENGTVVDGIANVEIDTNFGNHSIQGDQPRTAVGVIDENHLVFVVVDGRQEGYSEGVTLTELADIMVSLGATTAYNLDGGGSSTMYFNGAVINQPSNGGERATSDILYIAG